MDITTKFNIGELVEVISGQKAKKQGHIKEVRIYVSESTNKHTLQSINSVSIMYKLDNDILHLFHEKELNRV